MSTPLSVALATCAAYPQIDDDAALLTAALRELDVVAEPRIWTDDAVDWSAYAAVVVRGTWDYPTQRDRFLAWAHAVGSATVLANPADVLAWNTDKTYLRELAEAGLPVVPTGWLVPGDPGSSGALPSEGEYVVKPAVSAGSKDTARWTAGTDDAAAREHAQRLLDDGRTVMVQPYLASVDTRGETALLFFGGEFSHAITKGALLQPGMGMVEGTYAEETVDVRPATDAEREVAEAVLDQMRWDRADLAYARVDLVEAEDGSPLLLELELAEPSMFLENDPEAASRFAATIAGLVSLVA